MNILLIVPGEPPKQAVIDGSLKSMQDTIGGLIQAIYPWDDPVALVCNDEGKLIGLPPNRTLRHPETGEIYDIIHGTFFLCGLGNGDFTDLEPTLIEKYHKIFMFPDLFVKHDDRMIIFPLSII